MTKIRFYGAARQVTGSMHVVESNGYRVMLDCGMQQGKRKESFERNRNFPFNLTDINSMVLTHAHIDHSGNIPTAINQGFKGDVYTTYATKDLCELMLPDSAYVQQKDLEYVNKKRKRQGKALFEELYNMQQAEDSLKKFVPKNLGEYFDINENIKAYLINAGHILGSNMAVLKVKDGDKTFKIGYTGDLGRKNLPILRDPDKMFDIDYLIMESTYGGKDHKPLPTAFDKLAAIISETYKKGGKIIIPVFAVERAQEMLYVLNKLFVEKKIPPMPVFVDSPLTIRVTGVFKKHSECFDKDMMKFVEDNNNPFYLELVNYTREVEESMAINEYEKPCIILSATGMCEAGRILHHLKNNIQDSRTVILIVGYQAINTLGRRLVEGEKKVKIFGEPYSVKARVEVVNEFSAHAGQAALVDFVKQAAADGRLKKVFLVHGEEKQQEALIEALKKQGFNNVYNPEPGYEITI